MNCINKIYVYPLNSKRTIAKTVIFFILQCHCVLYITKNMLLSHLFLKNRLYITILITVRIRSCLMSKF